MNYGSRKIASAAIQMALTENRDDENQLKQQYLKLGIRTVAVDMAESM